MKYSRGYSFHQRVANSTARRWLNQRITEHTQQQLGDWPSTRRGCGSAPSSSAS